MKRHVAAKPCWIKGSAEGGVLPQGDAANGWRTDLIGMPTAGRNGFLVVLRGSITERVLRQAPRCSLLRHDAEN